MYLDVSIAYGETTLFPDLIVFPLKDFNVILGMDWLEKYKARVYCPKQKVTIESHKDVHVLYSRRPVKIISALTLKSYLRKGFPLTPQFLKQFIIYFINYIIYFSLCHDQIHVSLGITL